MKHSLLCALALVALSIVLPSHARAQSPLRDGEVFELNMTGMSPEYATEFRNVYTVEDGVVSIPYIGAVRAVGLTANQLARSIEKKLVDEKIFTTPTALITLQQQGRFVTVGGGVRAPQAVPWSNDLNLSTAIMRAGGRSDFAGWKVKVTRGGETKIYDYKKKDKDRSQNPKLQPGDEVEVPE